MKEYTLYIKVTVCELYVFLVIVFCRNILYKRIQFTYCSVLDVYCIYSCLLYYVEIYCIKEYNLLIVVCWMCIVYILSLHCTNGPVNLSGFKFYSNPAETLKLSQPVILAL